MKNIKVLDQVKGKLIVSCQALEDEPLHGSITMAKMALAAEAGGAAGIRANGIKDIAAIKKVTDLPIIGLIKRNYSDSEIFITASRLEIDELISVGVDMIALDATNRKRPNGETLAELIKHMKKNNQLIMADISTVEEGLNALELGADCISTTLSGYTEYTKSPNQEFDKELIKSLSQLTDQPVIAEGRIETPDEAQQALENGAYAVVVGSAITRPQCITERFARSINNK